MVSLDNLHISKEPKASSLSSDKSSLTDSDKSTLSFSDLLKGIALKSEKKDIQDGVLVLALEDKVQTPKDEKSISKKDSLLSLLKNTKKDLKTKDMIKVEELEIDPKITQSLSSNLTIKEVKSLIFKAKKYLKEKIQSCEAFKKSDIEKLPKTLKGLIAVAKKLDIDMSKITLEEVQSKNSKEVIKELDKKTKSTKHIKSKKIALQDIKSKKIALQDIKPSNNDIKIPKEILTQPIFKEISKKQFSTQQLIQARETKEISSKTKTPKSRADETLSSLLSGDKVKKSVSKETTDISITSTKVATPESKNNITKGLESLLFQQSDETSTDAHDTSDSSTTTKTDSLASVHKAESLEVKLNEAKQMIKYLSHDVKQAIDDYKSPFTRIKVQLNPQKLGEVDLTVVQRGKNLIVNLSSNNAAINTLAMNVNELRTQLNNTGINNATFNFNSQSEQQSSSEHNHQNEQRQAQKEYNHFENEEQNEEILNSLEIVVPHYA